MDKQRKTKGTADTLDKFVGNKVKEIRKKAGVSQSTLGDHLGVTFQQVQKYEKGTNRLSASRLGSIAIFFNVPIANLYPKEYSKIGKK